MRNGCRSGVVRGARKVVVYIEKMPVLRFASLPKSLELDEFKVALVKAAKRRRNPEKTSDMPPEAVLAWVQRCSQQTGRQLVGVGMSSKYHPDNPRTVARIRNSLRTAG